LWILRTWTFQKGSEPWDHSAKGLHDGDFARCLHFEEGQEPECRQAVPRLHPVEAGTGDYRQQGRPLFAARRRRWRGDNKRRHPADRRQVTPRANRSDAAGQSRPGQAARLPVEVAAGEEGTVRTILRSFRGRSKPGPPGIRKTNLALAAGFRDERYARARNDEDKCRSLYTARSCWASPRSLWRRRSRS